jgi:predicted amidophosphoribosyltransferase
MPSVLENGFGRTRTAIELYYGKLNNKYLLTHAIEQSIENIRGYTRGEGVDCVIFTPPTNDRTIQFRDILESLLSLKLPKIRVEKVPPFGKILQPQKDIKDRKERVQNALLSLQVTIPAELNFYKHILILDDSFTTGATPNAIAIKLRNAGYTGKITIITICGSFNYDLAITEDEI